MLNAIWPRLNTLRVRFALWVSGLVALVLIAFGAFMYARLSQGLYSSIDDSLSLSAAQAVAAVNIENGAINFSDSIPEETTTDLQARGLTIRVLAVNGHVIQAMGPYRDLPIDAVNLQAAQQQQTSYASRTGPANETVRFYTAPVIDNDQVIGIVQVAQSLVETQRTLDQLLTALLIGGPVLIVIAGLGGYGLAARALKPIDEMTRTARNIADSGDLSARLQLPTTQDEVGRLAFTFDAMLAKLDESFQRERQFTADASHELRTPLAALQAILSVIRETRRTPEDYEQALDDIAEETDRLRGLTEDLLRLARGANSTSAVLERVDVSALVNSVAESLRPLAEAKGLQLSCTADDDLGVMGNMDDLIRLLVNLVDNAIKYTEQGTIDLTARCDATGLTITVADTGPGIAAEHLPHIFDRFYRVDTSRSTTGSGLGLAIALDIAQAHGGQIEVSSELGRGTTFVVQLPADGRLGVERNSVVAR